MEADIDNDINDLEEVIKVLTIQSQGANPNARRVIFIVQIVMLLFGFIRCCMKSNASAPDLINE